MLAQRARGAPRAPAWLSCRRISEARSLGRTSRIPLLSLLPSQPSLPPTEPDRVLAHSCSCAGKIQGIFWWDGSCWDFLRESLRGAHVLHTL